MKKTKVILYGLGPIGARTAGILLTRPSIQIVGAVDIAENKRGKDLGELLELGKETGIAVSSSLGEALSKSWAEVVVHTTTSFLEDIYPQLEEIITNRMHCVSSTEELFFPLVRNPELTRRIDTLAKTHNVSVIGTGVNPGFVMDTLPVLLSAVCANIEKISIQRILDASTRRYPLQKKIGVALTIDEFHRKAKKEKVGHIGLVESLQFLATNLGWKLDEVKERVDPVVCEEDTRTQFFELKKGQVAGIKNIAEGMIDGRIAIALDLRMYVGTRNVGDIIHIEGNPSLRLEIKGGVPGDIATASILANCVDLVLRSSPGLVNIKEPLLPHWRAH